MLDVTMVVPTIPPRTKMLRRALWSIMQQTHSPSGIVVVADREHDGAAVVRNRGLAMVDTEWVAFVDDDDQLLPHHLERLIACAANTDADLVYPWFEHPGWQDPLGRFGLPFDGEYLQTANYIPVTVLARTKAIRAAGGFQPLAVDNPCEDWGCWLAMHQAGARIVHLPERTWVWNLHGGNTSGRSDRW